jgi:uncharacterized protein YjiS (DUF1127 family)
MTLVDLAAHRSFRSPLATGFRAVVQWLAACHAARVKRETLRRLLFAPEHRLRDLGISRDELISAIQEGRK